MVAQQVMNDPKLVYSALNRQFYKKYIRTKSIETMSISKDFTTFRVLGRRQLRRRTARRKTSQRHALRHEMYQQKAGESEALWIMCWKSVMY